MRLPAFACTVTALLLIAACSNTPPTVPAEAGTAPRPIGGDRDAHGCLPAAGYQWCARTNQCERPWELAKTEGFENTSDAYAAYCAGTTPAEISRPAS